VNPSWIVAVIAATLISHAAFAQRCPSSEEEMDDVMSVYNSKVSLMMAAHPEQLSLIGVYQNKFFALSNTVLARYFLISKRNLIPLNDEFAGVLCVRIKRCSAMDVLSGLTGEKPTLARNQGQQSQLAHFAPGGASMLVYRKSSVMTVPLLRWISDFDGKPVLSEIQMRASEAFPFVSLCITIRAVASPLSGPPPTF